MFAWASAARLLSAEPAREPARSPATIQTYAGGVAGISALIDPANSADYRSYGGGLYLHHTGWSRLNALSRSQVVELFTDLPAAIELGFRPDGDHRVWAKILRSVYLDAGLNPDFIAANAFDNNNQPTVEQWLLYTEALRKVGLADRCKVLPTFEYANFAANIKTLLGNTVSKRSDFQEIIALAGGIVLDSPSGYTFRREQAYRDWLLDAIRWCRLRGLEVVWIASPHTSGEHFPAHTRRWLAHFAALDALPTLVVCENYNPKENADWVNAVGADSKPASILGVALRLQRDWLPAAAVGDPLPK